MTFAIFPLLYIPKKYYNHIYTTELTGTYTELTLYPEVHNGLGSTMQG